MMEESSNNQKIFSPIAPGSIITIACRMLKNVNKHILFHNERTAFISMYLARRLNLNKNYSISNIVILCLFHTIGFFKDDVFFNTADISLSAEKDLFLNNHETEAKYVFACYYLQFMTPLKKESLALQSFFQPYNPDMERFIHEEKIKSIIYFAARVSEYVGKNPGAPLPEDLNQLDPEHFNPEVVEAFNKINTNNQMIAQIESKNHLNILYNYIQKIQMTDKEKNQYLKLLVYILDFKSTSTVTHSINTSCYALSLGMRLNLSNQLLSELFVSALLHDIGKICTPQRILEAPGQLSPEEMGIMRHHVNHSKKMVQDLVSPSILENIYRHHEKLNGKGYPQKLNKDQLNLLQRIITICDITSALNDSRSYKEKFDAEKTISILQKMAEDDELDKTVTNLLTSNFEAIKKDVHRFRKPLQADFSKILMKYNDYLFSDSLIDNIQIHEDSDFIEEAEMLAEPIEEI